MCCYMDMCFCRTSWRFYEGNKCRNKKCIRHMSHIPDDLPEWELISMADFGDVCEDYEEEEFEKHSSI